MDHQDVLDWINSTREEYGLGGGTPLARIPTGVPRESNCCPIANAFGGGPLAVHRWATVLRAWDDEEIAHPAYVAEFIRAFDAGEIPELIEHA